MVNEYALSTLHWFFLSCLMALEIPHYFLQEPFRKRSAIRHSRAACSGSFSTWATPAGVALGPSYSGVLAEKGALL